MDEQAAPVHHERSTLAGRFFNQLHRYKNLLLTWWWILLLTVGIGLGIQGFLLWHAPPAYRSVGRMIVNVRLSIPNANGYSEELNNFFGTQVALMQSDSVVNRVLLRLQSEQPDLHASLVTVQVNLSPKTSIFNLQAVGGEPNYTQAYLQAVMDEYINLKKELLENASDATKSSMQDELSQMALELNKSRQDLLDYQSSNSVVFLQQNGGNSAADYLSSLTRQLAEDKSEAQLIQTLTLDENLERQQGLFIQPGTPPPAATAATAPQSGSTPTPPAAASPQNAAPPPNAPSAAAANPPAANNTPSTLGGFESAYLLAKQQILILKARRDELGQYLRPKHPKIIAMNEEIARQENLLDIFRQQSQEQLKNRQHTLEVQMQNLEEQIQEWELKAVDTSRKLADYGALKDNNARLQVMYDQLLATLHTLDVNKGIGQESVTILMPATPAMLVRLELSKQYGMAGLLGLVAGICVLLLLNRLDDRPSSLSEMEQLFEEPVLGQIPWMKADKNNPGMLILDAEDDRHMLVEAYRNLRSSIIYMGDPQHHPKSIVITSAIPSDGKSTTSANLAIVLARAGARVLLVDADLRRGVLHKRFSVAAQPGLAEVLAGQCPWSNAVVPTVVPNLHLLPSGVLPSRGSDPFATQIDPFLKAIAGQYDYYLFDTAPVMAADDVSNLAPHVDGLIMVVRSRFTSGRVAQAALDLLHLRKVNVMGLVFNAMQQQASDYYYYKYKEYYSKTPAA